MEDDDDIDPAIEQVSFSQSADDDLIVAEYVTPNPDGIKERGGNTAKGRIMEREQVQDLIAASEARSDLKFEQILNEVRAINVNSAHQLLSFGTGLDSYQKSLTSLESKVDGIKADNIRTRSTVRTSAIGLASLFIAVTALLLNGLIGSFNVGSKVGDVSRAEALKVYEEKRVASEPVMKSAVADVSPSPAPTTGRGRP